MYFFNSLTWLNDLDTPFEKVASGLFIVHKKEDNI